MKEKTIFILIGPKGSGKSYIGSLIDKHFLIKFIRVEDGAKTVKRDREIDNQAYIQEVFQLIENGIREELSKNDRIVFESTGLTDYFDEMLNSLQRDFNVKSIKVIANDELCLTRVRTRNQSIHVDVSDDQVDKINKKVKERGFKADFSITNNNKTEVELIDELKKIIN